MTGDETRDLDDRIGRQMERLQAAVRQVLALYSWRDDMLDYVTGEILALVRPVAGVTLTPEEAALAATALRLYDVRDATVNTLAARLEAGS